MCSAGDGQPREREQDREVPRDRVGPGSARRQCGVADGPDRLGFGIGREREELERVVLTGMEIPGRGEGGQHLRHSGEHVELLAHPGDVPGLQHRGHQRPHGGTDHPLGTDEVDTTLSQLRQVRDLPGHEVEAATAEAQRAPEARAVAHLETAGPGQPVRRGWRSGFERDRPTACRDRGVGCDHGPTVAGPRRRPNGPGVPGAASADRGGGEGAASRARRRGRRGCRAPR